ncbi:MAG: aromatic ring-hydroxylating dioxygenase subunit alpha [Pseudomonadales bacterium]|nr:aromatic ring-hydroxylating dioxygenase subunit alpha [Pseudomonadales bacterium]
MVSRADLNSVTAPLEQATSLPPACYTQAAVFEQEKTRLFYREWICVAREEQIATAGDFVCVDVADQPLVIVRQKDGSIEALSSVCLHRAMPICSGSGNASSFSCPYHLWKYGLDGQLISAPLMDGAEDFHARDCRLPRAHVETWQGFVFVNLADEPKPLVPRLSRFDAMLAEYELGQTIIAATTEFDSPWNWKLLVENFMEAYHHIGPHSETLLPVYPAKDSYVVADDDHLWSILHMPGTLHADGEEDFPPFPKRAGQKNHHLVACVVSPTLIFAANDTSVFWYQLFPHAHNSMTLKIHLLLRPEVVADERFAPHIPEVLELARFVHLEDIAVNEGPWRGLHAPMARAGRLSPLEAAIWHMNQYWVNRVFDA